MKFLWKVALIVPVGKYQMLEKWWNMDTLPMEKERIIYDLNCVRHIDLVGKRFVWYNENKIYIFRCEE